MTPGGQTPHTFLRFLLVGGGMAVLYAVLAALATAHLPLPRALSSAGAWLLCIPLGFGLHRRFTFAASAPHRHAIWLYAGTQGVSIGTVATVSHLLAQGAFWPDLVVHLGGSALAAALSYLINRRFVFPVAADRAR